MPRAGLLDYQAEGYIAVPGGLVNANGGNLTISWEGPQLPTGLQVLEDAGAVYNSASGEWLFLFQMTYDGETFVDYTGAAYDVTNVTNGAAIPGSFWVKVDDYRVMTKGQLVYEFDISGALIERYWRGQLCPWIDYVATTDAGGNSVLRIQQHDCGGGVEWRAFNRQLFVVTYASAARERVVSILDPEAEREALFTWTADRLTAARDPLAVEKGWPGDRFEYSGSNLTAMTNSEGERIEYEYLDGRLQYATRIGEGDPQHRLDYYGKDMSGIYYTVHTNPLGERTRYGFDGQTRLREVEYVEVGLREFYAYHGAGLRPLEYTAINGRKTHFTYVGDDFETMASPSGNVITSTYAEGNNRDYPRGRALGEVRDLVGLIQERHYTVDGTYRLTAVLNGESEETSYGWGEHGGFTRLSSITDAYGTETLFSKYESTGHPTEIYQGDIRGFAEFDSAGFREEGLPRSPEWGGVRRREADANRNLVQITVVPSGPDGTVGPEAPVNITRRSDGQATYVARPGGADHEFIYNALGQLVERREKVDGVWESTFLEYDLIGRMTASELPNGMRREYDYDQLDRMTEKRAYRDDVLEGRIEYTYLGGALFSAYDSIRDATEFYSYDSAGRLHVVTYDHGETLTVGYDLRNRVISKTFALDDESWSKTIEYQYDLANRRVQTYDDGELVLQHTFLDGKLVSIWTGNDLERSFTYEPKFGLRSGASTEDLITEEIIETTTLGYQLLESPAVWEISSSTTVDSVVSGTVTEKYLMGPETVEDDPSTRVGRRVFSWEGTGGASKAYAYDELSNRVSADGDSFTYNAEGNRLLEATVDGDTVDYDYDEAGFVISRDGIPITWTATGRMASHGDFVFEWDMQNRFMGWSSSAGGRDLSWFGGEVETTGGVPVKLDLLEVVLDLQTGARSYRHADFRGNVQFASDDSGITTLHGYQPYGVDATLGDAGDGVGFVGRQEVGGLMLLGARVFDGVIFLSPDPVLSLLNQYSYTLGNPLWFEDRDGLKATASQIAKGFAIAVLTIAAISIVFAFATATGPFGICIAVIGGLIAIATALPVLAPTGGDAGANPGVNSAGGITKCLTFSDGGPDYGGAAAGDMGGQGPGPNPGPPETETEVEVNPTGAASFSSFDTGGSAGGGPGVEIGSVGCGMGGEVILPTLLVWWFCRRRKKQCVA